MRALEGREEPGNVSAGERRKGQEGLGGESRKGPGLEGPPRRDRLGRKGWEVRVPAGERRDPRERRVLERTIPGEEHPEMGQGRNPGEKKDPELERRETLVRKGEAVHSGDEFPVSES